MADKKLDNDAVSPGDDGNIEYSEDGTAVDAGDRQCLSSCNNQILNNANRSSPSLSRSPIKHSLRPSLTNNHQLSTIKPNYSNSGAGHNAHSNGAAHGNGVLGVLGVKFSTPSKSQSNRKRTESESSTLSQSSGSSLDMQAPDGGYGWVVVFAAFMTNLIADGVTFSFGVIFVHFLNQFGESKGKTAWIGSLFMGIPLLAGPIASTLTDRFGCRKVTIAGALLAAMGFILSYFANSVVVLYFTFGIMSGLGLALCYVAAVVIVAYYFDKRRAFATGISVCGSGIGTFIFAPLTEFLLDLYGWRGTILILAGLFLNIIVFGCLMRDLPWTSSKHRRKTSWKNKGETNPSSVDDPSLGGGFEDGFDENKRLLSIGGSNMIHMSTEDLREECERMCNSLVDLPTFLTNVESLPPDIMAVLASHRVVNYEFLLEHYPHLLPSGSYSLTNMSSTAANSEAAVVAPEGATNEQNALVSPCPSRTSLTNLIIAQEQNNSFSTHTPDSNADCNDNELGNADKMAGKMADGKLLHSVSLDDERHDKTMDLLGVVACDSGCAADDPTAHNDSANASNASLNRLGAGRSRDKSKSENLERRVTIGDVGVIENGFKPIGAQKTAGVRSPRLTRKLSTAYLRNLHVHRRSMTYRGAMLNLHRYRLRASSCPNIYRNSMITLADEDESECCDFMKDLKDAILDMVDISHFSNVKFLLFCISNLLLYVWFDVPYIYLNHHALSEGYSDSQASFLISVIGILNTLGEITLGYIGDKPWLSTGLLYSLFTALSGAAVFCVPFQTTYVGLCCAAGVFGFAISANYSLTSIIVVDLITLEKFTNAYGLLLLVQGVANLIGPPLAGFLHDLTGSYNLSFYMGGIFIFLSGIILFILPLNKYFRRRWSSATGETDVEENDARI